ncbi:hypothetical protein [uncultured Parasutterella sp.]|jgi:hypothetical protein|uniref:hypothetical protein n=1 Tax=uncultured Parasutterella sp. TaxID=1263098 RepID=UPI002595B320|nr:hypothetical protein [uncultured Parasutterella sp.]
MYICSVYKKNGVYFCDGGEDGPAERRFTKKELIDGFKGAVPELEAYECLLGVKVENIDDFLKASWLACAIYGAFNVPFNKRTEEFPDDDGYDGLLFKTGLMLSPEDAKTAVELAEQYKIKQPVDFYDSFTREEIARLWSVGDERMGLDFYDMMGFYKLTAVDIISINDKYKTAVVQTLMADIMDDARAVLDGSNAGGDKDIRADLTVADYLELPED